MPHEARIKPSVFYVFLLLAGGLLAGSSVSASQSAKVNATAKTAVCGNGIKEGGEQCDGHAYGGVSCASLGFIGGTVSCSPSCEYGVSLCQARANNVFQGDFQAATGGSHTYTNADGSGVAVTLPAYAFHEDLHLYLFAMTSATATALMPPPPGLLAAANAYDFSFIDQDGDKVDALQHPATITITYTDAGTQGIDTSTLRPYHWNAVSNAWEAVTGAVVDTAHDRASFSASNFSAYMLMGSPPSVASSFGGGGGGGGAVLRGAVVTFNGTAPAGSTVTLLKDGQLAASITASDDGTFRLGVAGLTAGTYHFGIEVTEADGYTSPLIMYHLDVAADAAMNVGDVQIAARTPAPVPSKPPAPTPEAVTGDLNGDGKVDLVDFSIAAYWYGRPACPASVDLNADGKITLTDFSIMASHWTG